MKENKKLFIVFLIAAIITFALSKHFHKINEIFWENIFIGLFTSSVISVITSYLIYRLNYKQELKKIMTKTYNLALSLEKIWDHTDIINSKKEKSLFDKINAIYNDSIYISKNIENLTFLFNYKERKLLKNIQNFSSSIYNSLKLDYSYLEKSKNDNRKILLLKMLFSLKSIKFDNKFTKSCSKITIKNDYLDIFSQEYLNNSTESEAEPINQYLKGFKKEYINLLNIK